MSNSAHRTPGANNNPFPHPVVSEPTPYSIVDSAREELETGRAWLKRLGLPEPGADLSAEEAARVESFTSQVRPEYQRLFLSAQQDVGPYARWSEHRETYSVHPAMTTSLMKMRSTTEIPGSVFRALRHPNPLFVTPAAPPVVHFDGAPGRIIGMFITGAVTNIYKSRGAQLSSDAPKGAVLADSHDPHSNAFHVMAMSEVHSADGTQVIDRDWCHLNIPVHDDFTLDSLVSTTADGFRWPQEHVTLRQQEQGRSYLETIARYAISHLLYACSRTVEIDKGRNDRPPAKRKSGQPKPRKPARVHPVGFRTGAAIADGVRRDQGSGTSVPTGKKKAPHMRAAHPHIYRVGPGRQEIDLKWLGPIPVNASADDGTTVPLHPMK